MQKRKTMRRLREIIEHHHIRELNQTGSLEADFYLFAKCVSSDGYFI